MHLEQALYTSLILTQVAERINTSLHHGQIVVLGVHWEFFFMLSPVEIT
jgi:hypothetical protein